MWRILERGCTTLVVYGGPSHLAQFDLADGTQDGRISLAGLDGTMVS